MQAAAGSPSAPGGRIRMGRETQLTSGMFGFVFRSVFEML